MKFDVYGRFVLEVVRERDGWIVRRVENGRRWVLTVMIIPPDLPECRIGRYLEDLTHEYATPDRVIRLLE